MLFTKLWLALACLLPSAALAWLAGYAIRWLAPRVGLIDRPGERKVHQVPTPLGGGLAIWVGCLLPLLILAWVVQGGGATLIAASLPKTLNELLLLHQTGLQQKLPDLAILLGLGTILMVLGLMDDRKGLAWQARMSVQFAVALTVVLWRGWRLTAFVDAPWLTIPLSVFWIVWLINAFNMLDNMDGLSAGISTIVALTMAAVLLSTPEPKGIGPQWFVAGLLLTLAGAQLGFLFHNRTPARLFMGDAGSYFIGFCLAMATLLATFAGGDAPRHAIAAPLCVLAIPLYDTASVIWIRLKAGRSPFQGDKSHFSHRLVDLGLSKPQAVSTIYLATLGTGLGALLLHQVNLFGSLVILGMVACFLSLVAILENARSPRT